MISRNASKTAQATAALRAAHQLFDATPRVLDDPAILRLLGADAVQRVSTNRERYCSRAALALRAHVVLRSRFAEDRLSEAVRRGVGQYVMLGAGLDTFAYRQPGWAASLRIVEVDHVASQEAKRVSLRDAGMTPPTNLHYASIDFEHESLREGLLRQGVAADRPTFFAWLGVTMYLEEAAVDAVLRSVATYPPGSEMVLSFSSPVESAGVSRDAREQLAARVAEAGEPFVSLFTPQEIEFKLRSAGFAAVEFLTPEVSASRYFSGRTDLPAPQRLSIVSAMV